MPHEDRSEIGRYHEQTQKIKRSDQTSRTSQGTHSEKQKTTEQKDVKKEPGKPERPDLMKYLGLSEIAPYMIANDI